MLDSYLTLDNLLIFGAAAVLGVVWLWKKRKQRNSESVPTDWFIGWTPESPHLTIRRVQRDAKEYRWRLPDDEEGNARYVRFPLDTKYRMKVHDEVTGDVIPAYMGNVHTGQLTVWRLRDGTEDEYEEVTVPEVQGQFIRPIQTVEQLEMDGNYLDVALTDGREINMAKGMRRSEAPKKKSWFFDLPRWQQIAILAAGAYFLMQSGVI